MMLALLLAAAEPTDSVCIRQEPPPRGLEAWTRPIAGDREIAPGTAETLTLVDVADLRFDAPPAQAPLGGTYGAMLAFRITTPGIYRIALSARASIDVAQAGRTIEPAGESDAPICTGIRKIIRFPLQPGSYALQISGVAGPQATVLLASSPVSAPAPGR
jgi:hypothetical protein